MTNNNQNQPIFTFPIFDFYENGVLRECDLNGNTDIVLPESVQEIGDRVFFESENLINIIIPYDKFFKSYDDLMELKTNIVTSHVARLGLCLTQLLTRKDLDAKEKMKYQKYLWRGAKKLVCKMIDTENMEGLMRCEQAWLLQKSNIDSFVEYAGEKGKVAMKAYLMNYKHEHFPVK